MKTLLCMNILDMYPRIFISIFWKNKMNIKYLLFRGAVLEKNLLNYKHACHSC